MKNINFIDNPAVTASIDKYDSVNVDAAKVLESWRSSLFSYEWVLPDGRIKTADELPDSEKEKRKAVEQKLQKNEPLEKPVLGIGLLENVEIGMGRHIFLTLAAQGIEQIPVHIPKSHKKDFDPFLS